MLLRVDLLARPMHDRPTGFWWLSTGELVGAQIAEALSVRRGLAAKVTPVAGGPGAEEAALEMAATFSYFLAELRYNLVEEPFLERQYSTTEDPRGHRAAKLGARLCARLLGSANVIERPEGFFVIMAGEIEPEAAFLLAEPRPGSREGSN